MIEYLRQMDHLNWLLALLVVYLILLFIPSKNRGKRGKALEASLELAAKKMVQEVLKKEKREEMPFFVGFGDGDSGGESSLGSPPWYFIKLAILGLPIFSVVKVTSMKELILKRVISLKDEPNKKKSFQETFKITTKSEKFRVELGRIKLR